MEGVTKRQGANLPHWTCPGGTYFVTFRLEDSIPKSKLEEWKEEQARAIRIREQALKRHLTEPERLAIVRKHRRAAEDYLDEGRGACVLRHPQNALLVRDAMLRQIEHTLHTWCIMPNHVHCLLTVPDEKALPKVLHSWKSYTATMINRNVGRQGTLWQSESFDHLLRGADDFVRISLYIL